MPNLNPLRTVFSEGKTEGQSSTAGRSGLTGQEVANRLYPKPADSSLREAPQPAAPADEAATATDATAEPEAEASTAKEPEATAATEQPSPDGEVAAPEAATAATTPEPAATMVGSAAAGSANGAAPAEQKLSSIISRDAVFDGNFMGEGDLKVEGEMRGDITCKGHVVITEGASVNAKVSATSVSAAGRLSGEVTCSERFEALPSAKITSQISTPRLIIQDGAAIDGQIHMQVPS
jgi:cytoskeletal protein CcmA (bactofilin family)